MQALTYVLNHPWYYPHNSTNIPSSYKILKRGGLSGSTPPLLIGRLGQKTALRRGLTDRAGGRIAIVRWAGPLFAVEFSVLSSSERHRYGTRHDREGRIDGFVRGMASRERYCGMADRVALRIVFRSLTRALNHWA